jgi:hypothetical protein
MSASIESGLRDGLARNIFDDVFSSSDSVASNGIGLSVNAEL